MSGREALTKEPCDHRLVDAWVIDDGQPDAGRVVAWACRFCRRKFAPKDQATVSPPTKHPEALTAMGEAVVELMTGSGPLSPESETLLRSWDLGDDPVTAEWLRPRLAAIEAAAAREALGTEAKRWHRTATIVAGGLDIVVSYLRDHDDGMSGDWLSVVGIAETSLGMAQEALDRAARASDGGR